MKKSFKISYIIIFAVALMIVFYFVYGGMMLLRYILGGLLFATFTVTLIHIIQSKFGKKSVKIRRR